MNTVLKRSLQSIVSEINDTIPNQDILSITGTMNDSQEIYNHIKRYSNDDNFTDRASALISNDLLNTLNLELKVHYGNKLYYPRCDKSSVILGISGAKSFTQDKVNSLRAVFSVSVSFEGSKL